MLLPFTRNRFVYRSPDEALGGQSGAGTAPEAPAAGTAEGAGPETPAANAGGDTPKPSAGKDKAGKAAPPAQPTRDTDNSAYLRILEKAESNPNYQLTDAEAEVFGRVQDRDEADIPKRGKGKAKAEAPPDPEDGNEDPAEAGDKEAPPEGGDDEPPAGDEDDDEVPEGLSEFVGKDSPFGAKTAKELPAKMREFTAKFKELQDKSADNGRVKQRLTNQTDFLHRFINGDPKAIEFAEANLGYKRPGGAPAPQRQGQQQPKPGKLNRAAILDDELAAYVEGLESKVDAFEGRFAKIEGLHHKTEQDNATVQAQNQVIDEMTTLVEKYPDLAIKGGSLRELAKAYLTDPTLEKVDPRFKAMAEIFHLAADKGHPDLESAYAYWRLKTLPQTVNDAERRGRESLANNKPSRGLSDRQGSSGGQYQAYSDADIQKMATGHLEIPQDWQDRDGNLIREKLPKRLRDRFDQMVTAE